MKNMANFHTHTVYCDGSLTPEEMVKAAIAKGCTALGFSGHSYAPFDPNHSMSLALTELYIAEISRLKSEYSGKIEIYTGIEQEYYSETPVDIYDYVIGSVHYIKKDDEYVCVDAGAKIQQMSVDTFYGGDFYTFAEDYYNVIATVAEKTSADIVGHFDLVAKYNQGNRCFNEDDPRYRRAAIGAIERILPHCKIFEVNTGAMYNHGRTQPYPPAFLLREINRRGGEVILSSDSHDAGSLCYKFDEMAQLLRDCGFEYQKRLTKNGFVDDLLFLKEK